MKKMSTYLFAAVIAAGLCSCTVSENIGLTDSVSSSSTDITVYPFFIDVLNDFSEFLPSSNESIMDAAVRDFSSKLEDSGKAWDVGYIKTGENSYTINFSFHDITSIVSALKGSGGTTVITEGDGKLGFHLDINNYQELKAVIPFLSDPNFEVYGLEFNQGMSKEDYLDMIYYLLGEDGPDAITNSTIDIRISTPGTITSCFGATKTGPSSVLYSFPLIDFLLLAEPMEFEIAWK